MYVARDKGHRLTKAKTIFLALDGKKGKAARLLFACLARSNQHQVRSHDDTAPQQAQALGLRAWVLREAMNAAGPDSLQSLLDKVGPKQPRKSRHSRANTPETGGIESPQIRGRFPVPLQCDCIDGRNASASSFKIKVAAAAVE
jgi:hypothetical protein